MITGTFPVYTTDDCEEVIIFEIVLQITWTEPAD
jgi:hypothetical protein